jgi:hypothetical protein
MLKKALLGVALLAVAVVLTASGLYLTNAAPAVPLISAANAANKPYVVKLHAKWCPVCMVTKGVWSEIASSYSTRANLVVFDFTNEATTAASRAEAARLGLGKFFEEYDGATGIIAVLDGRTREERASIAGSREFADYRSAIDAALAATP